jgi:hypothetical protein
MGTTVALAMALAMALTVSLTCEAQGVRSTTGGLATDLAYTTHDVLTALANVTGDLGSTFQGLAKNTYNTSHF